MPKSKDNARVPMRTSLRTIANLAGVSVNTVSYILNRDKADLYREKTVKLVRKIAAERGYRPNLAAKMLLSNSSQMIGFVTWTLDASSGSLNNPVVYPFIIGASDYLLEHGYHIVIIGLKELRDDPNPIPRSLKNHFFDGIFLQQGRWDHLNQWQKETPTPIIHWDSGVFGANNCLYRDELQVGLTLTRKLISLGHSKIGFFTSENMWVRLQRYFSNPKGDPSDSGQPVSAHNLSADHLHYSFIQRYQGYLQAMKENKLKPIVIRHHEKLSVAEQLLEHEPSAMATHGPRSFYYIDHACQKLGWSIPEKLTVACFDVDIRVPAMEGYDFGGITYDRYEAGRIGAEMMLNVIKGKIKKVKSRSFSGEFRLGATISGFKKAK